MIIFINMNFNLVPWDPEAYLVAADYAEENGYLLSNAIRNKILPLSCTKEDYTHNNYGYYSGDGSGSGWGRGTGDGDGFRTHCNHHECHGTGDGDGSGCGEGKRANSY